MQRRGEGKKKNCYHDHYHVKGDYASYLMYRKAFFGNFSAYELRNYTYNLNF